LQRIQQYGIPQCCLDLNLHDSSLSESDKRTLWTILAAGHAPLPRLFEGIRVFLGNESMEAQLAIASILRHYPKTSSAKFLEAMAPEALRSENSNSLDPVDETDDNGSQFRQDVRKLLGVLPKCEPNLRNAIEEFFDEFHIEALLTHLDSLMDDAIECFAEVMRALHPHWPLMLIPALEAPEGKRRRLAAIAASYLGPHPDIKFALTKLLQDKYMVVQEEAEYALKAYPVSSAPIIAAPLSPHTKPTANTSTEATF
jgi:hypothetical protein